MNPLVHHCGNVVEQLAVDPDFLKILLQVVTKLHRSRHTRQKVSTRGQPSMVIPTEQPLNPAKRADQLTLLRI